MKGHQYATQKLPARPRKVTRAQPLLRRNPGHSYATAEDVAPADAPWTWPVIIGGAAVLGLLFWWGVRSAPAPVVK